MLCEQQDIASAFSGVHLHQLVSLNHFDGNQSPAGFVVFAECGALDLAPAGDHHQVFEGLVVAGVDYGTDALVRLERQHRLGQHPFGGAGLAGNLVGFDAVHPSLVAEKQQVSVGGGMQNMGEKIAFPHRRPFYPPSAPALGAVHPGVHRFHIAVGGGGEHQFVVGHQILERQFPFVGLDAGAAGVVVHPAHLLQLFGDYGPATGRRGQDGAQVGDQLPQVLQLGPQFFGLQRSQAAQRHIQHRPGLDVGKFKPFHQGGAGLVGFGAAADDGHHLVDVVHRRHQPFQDVGPGLRPVQPEPGAPFDHLHLVVQEILDHLGDVQSLGHAVHQGHRVHSETLLQLGQLVKLVEHHLGDGASLQFDHQPHPHSGG